MDAAENVKLASEQDALVQGKMLHVQTGTKRCDGGAYHQMTPGAKFVLVRADPVMDSVEIGPPFRSEAEFETASATVLDGDPEAT